MFNIKGKQASRIEPVTFSNDIEEILRNSIDMICDEEESSLLSADKLKMKKTEEVI